MLLKHLRFADILSFISLFFAWISIVLVIYGSPNWAIIMNMCAFTFDLLDGYVARRNNDQLTLGRYIDSYCDIFTYLIFPVLLYYKYLTPNIPIGIIIGFLIFLFGGLRLIRYNNEGILKYKDIKYYRGVTVTHISGIIIFYYLLSQFISLTHQEWVISIILFIISPLMLSNYKSKKIENVFFFCTIIFLIIFLSLKIENGN